MKHFLLPLILFLAALQTARAQDMAAFFIAMPDHRIPQLEEAWRKDLVDLYRAGKPATLENMMGGRATLILLTEDYLLLQTTAQSTLEMKLLPLVNHTHVACVVTTLGAPAPDSRVAFFAPDWTPLDAASLWTPPAGEWYLRHDVDPHDPLLRRATSCLDMHLTHFRLSPDSPTLSAEYATPQYLSPDERDALRPFLADTPHVCRWNDGRFE
ncbi:MAG: DUF3256 family protein [Tannerella sp.]|jgi:hypothetical protein|nr:DUF3256 family protein [Tannerella sp.]